MESRVKQVMSSTLTPAQRTSSVDISSSISEVQFSKITCMQVHSTLAQDNFFFCQVWYKVLKSYCHCCPGRFIHAILQPILSKLKEGTSHNDGVDNSDTRFVLVDQSYKSSLFFFFLLSTHLGIIFHFSIDNREPDFAGGRPAMASKTCGSPQAKRCKQEEQELQFLLVKSKDGQRCPFVDLGEKTQKWWTNRCPFFHNVLFTNIRSLHQEQKFPPVQVIEGWEEDDVHRGEGQRISRQTREEHFCRGKCVFGFLNLQCEVRSHFSSVLLFSVTVYLNCVHP